MIRRIFLIARQEFLKYVTRRGFFISILMVPLFIGIAAGVPILFSAHVRTSVITVVDRAGGYEQAIEAAAQRDTAQTALVALAKYALQYANMRPLAQADPALAAILTGPTRIAHIKAFEARGGLPEALAKLSTYLRLGAPAFVAPQPHFLIVRARKELAEAGDIRARARSYLAGANSAAGNRDRISAILVIPQGFAPGSMAPAQYWATDTTSADGLNFVRTALDDALRVRAVQILLPSSRRQDVNLDVDAQLQTFDPTKPAGDHVSLTERLAPFVPMALAVLLFIVAFSNSMLLLQSVIEEKSTRMIEVLLSCASPQEIMTGKLLGVVAVAIVTLFLWGAGLFVVASLVSHEATGVVAAGLAALATAQMLPLILLYFFCGLLIYSAIFLSIGAMANSVPDAQALMTPTMLIIMLPNMLMGVLIRDPNGLLATIISWIPIYTPFFMLVRLPFHPPIVQIWLTAILVVVTTVFLIRQSGRIFAKHVLSTERPPAIGEMVQRLLGRKPA
jgi:ABC-2 type transport system permease protein